MVLCWFCIGCLNPASTIKFNYWNSTIDTVKCFTILLYERANYRINNRSVVNIYTGLIYDNDDAKSQKIEKLITPCRPYNVKIDSEIATFIKSAISRRAKLAT